LAMCAETSSSSYEAGDRPRINGRNQGVSGRKSGARVVDRRRISPARSRLSIPSFCRRNARCRPPHRRGYGGRQPWLSTYVARGVDRAGAACDGRYARKHGGLLAHLGEYPGGCVLLQRGGQLEESMRTRRTRVHDALGNTFVIEMGDFFAEDEILQKRRAARIGPERVLIIGKCEALVRGERAVTSTSGLVQFAAGSRVCGSVRGRAFFLFVFSRLTRCSFFAHDLSPWRVLPAYRTGLRASGPRPSRSEIRAPDVLFFQHLIPWPPFFRNNTVRVCLNGTNPDSDGFAPARRRITAFAGLAQCDSNGLLDRFSLCRRMAGAYRSVLLPVIHQCLDVAAYHRLAGSFSEQHDIPPVRRFNWARTLSVAAPQRG